MTKFKYRPLLIIMFMSGLSIFYNFSFIKDGNANESITNPIENSNEHPRHVDSNGMAYYENPRFNFVIKYPADLLFPHRESDNGDGSSFISKDKKTMLSAWGSINARDVDGWTFKKEFERQSSSRKGITITYKAMRNNWFVISGYDGEDIFYTKVFSSKESFIGFKIKYPSNQKDIWNKVTADIGNEFKIHNL